MHKVYLLQALACCNLTMLKALYAYCAMVCTYAGACLRVYVQGLRMVEHLSVLCCASDLWPLTELFDMYQFLCKGRQGFPSVTRPASLHHSLSCKCWLLAKQQQ